MNKIVSKVTFFSFLEKVSHSYNVQISTSYSEISRKYYTTYWYVDSDENIVNLCCQDFDLISDSIDYIIFEE